MKDTGASLKYCGATAVTQTEDKMQPFHLLVVNFQFLTVF